MALRVKEPPDPERQMLAPLERRAHHRRMSDPRLVDVFYPDDERPAGVVERAVGVDIIGKIGALAAVMNERFRTVPAQRDDCRYASAAWERTLQGEGVDARFVGGEGIDEDVHRGYMLVPLDRRTGYLEGDGLMHRHYWLEIGPERHIFDPTAHQFDDRGGVALERDIIDGVPRS